MHGPPLGEYQECALKQVSSNIPHIPFSFTLCNHPVTLFDAT